MIQKLKNAFFTALLLSVVVTFAAFILPRFVFQSYYSANLIEGIKISLVAFLAVFVLSFICTFIYLNYHEFKVKRDEKRAKEMKKKNKHRN